MIRLITAAMALALAGAMASCVTTEEIAEQGTIPLFTAHTVPTNASHVEAEDAVVGVLGVHIHRSLLEPDEIVVGDQLQIVVMNDREVIATVEAVDVRGEHRSLRGNIDPPGTGHIALTVSGARVWGEIQIHDPVERYYVRFDEVLDRHLLVKVDPDREDILPGEEAVPDGAPDPRD